MERFHIKELKLVVKNVMLLITMKDVSCIYIQLILIEKKM